MELLRFKTKPSNKQIIVRVALGAEKMEVT